MYSRKVTDLKLAYSNNEPKNMRPSLDHLLFFHQVTILTMEAGERREPRDVGASVGHDASRGHGSCRRREQGEQLSWW